MTHLAVSRAQRRNVVLGVFLDKIVEGCEDLEFRDDVVDIRREGAQRG